MAGRGESGLGMWGEVDRIKRQLCACWRLTLPVKRQPIDITGLTLGYRITMGTLGCAIYPCQVHPWPVYVMPDCVYAKFEQAGTLPRCECGARQAGRRSKKSWDSYSGENLTTPPGRISVGVPSYLLFSGCHVLVIIAIYCNGIFCVALVRVWE